MKRILMASMTIAAMLFLVSTGSAATITWDYTNLFSGTAPAGIATATLTDVTGGVRITMSAAGLAPGEFVDGGQSNDGFFFNLNPAISAIKAPSYVAGNTADSIGFSTNGFKADGDGYYDLQFAWNPDASSRLTGTGLQGIATYEILGLTTDDFDFTSVNGIPGTGNYLSAVHVQGIGPDDNSGWLSPGGGIPVPEPGSMLLLGGGLLGLASWGRKRFRK